MQRIISKKPLRRANGYYYYKYIDDDGKRQMASLKTKNAVEAAGRMRLARAGSPLVAPRSPGKEHDPTPAEFWAAYGPWCQSHKEPGSYRTEHLSWQRFVALVHPLSLGSVVRADIEAAKMALVEDGKSPVTINNWVRDMKLIYNGGIKQGFISCANPFEGVRRLAVADRPVQTNTDAECETILAVARVHGPDAHLFIALCLYCGLRKREAIYAQWADINPEGTMLKVVNRASDGFRTKTKRNRAVPIPEVLKAILEPHRRPAGYICKGHVNSPDGRYRWEPQHVLEDIREGAEIEFSPLTLRHTYATRLYNAGVPEAKIASWMGNSPAVLRKNYFNITPQASDVDLLNRSVGTCNTTKSNSSPSLRPFSQAS